MAPATTTIKALPHEIVIRIVEFTDIIARHDRQRRLLAEEEAQIAAHHAAHHHLHDGEGDDDPDAAGHDLDALIDGGPMPPNGGGPVIGGQDFMANLFGMFGGPPPGAAGAAAPPAPAGAQAAPQPQNGNGNGNAGGPAGLFGTLMQALGAQPGQGMPGQPGPEDDESDDEMPGDLHFCDL